MNENINGFYGDDGEFYPEGSQSAEIYRQSHNIKDIYPKRPDISYTTEQMPFNIKVDGGEAYPVPAEPQGKTKFCKYCGSKIDFDAVVCIHCGKQVELLKHEPVYTNQINFNTKYKSKCEKNKWIAFILCLLFGVFGVHKFYEGKIGLGILYLLTGGLCGIGWIIDAIRLFFKPNPYTV